jgi:hypothetical protein
LLRPDSVRRLPVRVALEVIANREQRAVRARAAHRPAALPRVRSAADTCAPRVRVAGASQRPISRLAARPSAAAAARATRATRAPRLPGVARSAAGRTSGRAAFSAAGAAAHAGPAVTCTGRTARASARPRGVRATGSGPLLAFPRAVAARNLREEREPRCEPECPRRRVELRSAGHTEHDPRTGDRGSRSWSLSVKLLNGCLHRCTGLRRIDHGSDGLDDDLG